MEQILTIENMRIFKNNKLIINDLSLNFFKGINTFICGVSGSGKTTLLKAILENNAAIKAKGEVAVILDNRKFYTEKVADEVKYLLLNEQQRLLVNSFFNEEKLQQNPNSLSFYDQKILNICAKLYQNANLFFIDDIYTFLKQEDRKRFNEYFEQNDITTVIISKNIELALEYPYMIILNDGNVAIEGKTMQVLKEEKLLKRLGIGLPFYIDVSLQLNLYNLIDKIYLNKEELADALWK